MSPNTRTLSRRNALIGASTGVAVAAIAVRAAQAMASAAPVDAGADAELIHLCNEWRRFARCHDRLYERAGPLEETDEERFHILQSLAVGICERKMAPLAQQIAELPVTSWAGVAAKARVLASDVSFAYTGHCGDFLRCLFPIVASMVQDATRLGGTPMPVPDLARRRRIEMEV